MRTRKQQKPRLLARTSYNEAALPAIRLVQSSRNARRVAKGLLLLLVATSIAVGFAPWQQNISGTGRVIAYAPLQRQQVIEAPITGRIAEWNESIVEGLWVKEGQRILEIRDIDPNFQIRLDQQLAATERELESNRKIVLAYLEQVDAFRTVLEQTVAAADQYVKMAEQKITAEQRSFDGERVAEEQELTNLDRQPNYMRKVLHRR